MNNRIRSLFWAFVLILATSGCTPSGETVPVQQEQKHFLWKAQDHSSTVYLAGSIHLLKANVYPLPDAFENAFAASSKLVLELNLDSLDMNSVTQLLLEKGAFKDGRTLKDVLPDSVYTKAQEKLQSFGYDIASMNMFRPWFVTFLLSALEMQKSGFEAEHGLDVHFFGKARKAGYAISGLETVEEQVRTFESISEKSQISVLTQTVMSTEPMDKELDEMLTAWKTGDTEWVERNAVQELQNDPEAMEAMLIKRNKRWIPQIERMLHSGDTTFVVVGAAHLAGESGLISLLRKRGYTVEQL